jgi:hypothetical protein
MRPEPGVFHVQFDLIIMELAAFEPTHDSIQKGCPEQYYENRVNFMVNHSRSALVIRAGRGSGRQRLRPSSPSPLPAAP